MDLNKEIKEFCENRTFLKSVVSTQIYNLIGDNQFVLTPPCYIKENGEYILLRDMEMIKGYMYINGYIDLNSLLVENIYDIFLEIKKRKNG